MTRAEQSGERAYQEIQAQVAQLTDPNVVRVYGEPELTSAQRASREEIIAHWVLCADLEREFAAQNVVLDPHKLWGQNVREVAEAKAARGRRRAGYKALKRQVGEEIAKRIISREGR